MLTLGSIEEQMMRSWFKQAWWSSVVADAESRVATLREKVVIALNAQDIAALKPAVKQMMSSGSRTVLGGILPPPRLSPFFVGRTEERGKLLCILERHGSAAITQYGGAGKTQLMVSFDKCAREQGTDTRWYFLGHCGRQQGKSFVVVC